MLQEGLKTWYKEFYEAGKDGLTEDDIENLRLSWHSFVEGQKKAYEDWEKVTGIDLEYKDARSAQGLTGAIQAIQEPTANLIAGQFSAMLVTQRNMSESMNEVADYSLRSFEALEQIAENTRHNEKLNSIDQRLQQMNTYLRDI
jgi:hypothetical protein